mmetsp:Transcript_9931/g.14963  ORF Transcript_9931/g.14963 Transcript_9931/m.14963 type:complete len:427 (+) Transcript_9931:42-1322(+)|eukprot:CAMPEP_0185025242 /NCGR_PEP_ID=MMETSP1103-20130426/8271_1 /TAXON_ID=36769 /ORGANISM="Paraphysomonas bandaiensis, Strain Caron Lab Isolate" /LENGTH=426 /DNA_ID=CAMNT_0027558393 /DNA_START=23 /DNA_END=1303 /DNA_ORIENTATION=-
MIFTVFILFITGIFSRTIDFEEIGGVPNDDSIETVWSNGALINTTLNSLLPGDTLIFPSKTFYVMGGIKANGISDVTLQFDGVIIFSNNTEQWPKNEDGDVFECIYMNNISNVKFTSSKTGILDGNGRKWWGLPGIGYLRRVENRPRLFNVENSKNLLVENILFKDSPYWTFWVHSVDGLEVRHCEISARRTDYNNHTLIDMTAFNTDGFDVTGRNVWIHDCEVWTQDDCIAVKDDSQDMLFERITASGVGLTIGSIGSSTVRNITFRDCYMPNSYKGIYMKFRDGDGGLIEDVTFENILIENPSQWPIWIGPAQQSDSRRLCAAHPCSLCWPTLPSAECNAPTSQYRNILLKNITISNPKMSPGVILGNTSTPMEDVVFDSVQVINPGMEPWGEDYYACDGVASGVAKGSTWPVPPCFKDETDTA